jgi:hypothetical protein
MSSGSLSAFPLGTLEEMELMYEARDLPLPQDLDKTQ